MYWQLTRRSLTGAALWLVLAVVCIVAPFDELADKSDLFEFLGTIRQICSRFVLGRRRHPHPIIKMKNLGLPTT